MTFSSDLDSTIRTLSAAGKGILAADESEATISKRFAALQIPTTETMRQTWRDLLITTPGVNEYIAGIILFEETLHQTTLDGTPFPERLKQLGILPGIKVDKGLTLLPGTREEQITQGLDQLGDRLAKYREKGARFAKWRAVYTISDTTPSRLAILANADALARYAGLCHAHGIVPIVEPEVLLDGSHTLERCAVVTESVLHAVFHALHEHHVSLEHIVLKPSMVLSGKTCPKRADVDAVAAATLTVLKRTVPAAVPTINFLSGGQTPEEATAHLNAMHVQGGNTLPWNLSYSYARALQDQAMKAWHGDASQIPAAQKLFFHRARLNSLAAAGKYRAALEKEGSIA